MILNRTQYEIAFPLCDSAVFSEFYLDSYPALAWKCGFDIAPESLYFMLTGKTAMEAKSVAYAKYSIFFHES